MSNQVKIDLDAVAKEERKANAIGYTLYKINPKNKASFVQIIKENLFQLVETKYLSNAELGFIFSLTPLIEMHTNALARPDNGQFFTITEIANFLGRDLSGTSKSINKLIEKGILYEFVDVNEIKKYRRLVSQRPIFMNPEIVYCGDRNKIDATLCRLVINADHLEKQGIKLEWKVWLQPNDKHGRLYRRKTYLKYKAQTQGK